ncbi:hypothetical protein [Kiloniella antarctica]|uniref:Tip attachment protein J domain-containing protein n=1 Tax=Kiloniella antarctica TaxID=1550907 RepID=A0ABW5BPG5_9PROT
MPYVTKNHGPTSYVKLGVDLGLETGDKVRVSSAVDLPDPLLVDTDYFIIRSSGVKLAFAASESDALNGNFISISGGSGAMTIRPVEVLHVTDKHALRDGDVVRVSSTGDLPAPLAVDTDYHCYVMSNKRIRLSNALNGPVIQLTASGTGSLSVKRAGTRRYRLNGDFESSLKPREVIENMLTCCAGDLIPSGGAWYIQPGVWEPTTIELDVDDLRGAIKISPRTTRRDLFNAIKGKYISPDNDHQPADYPVIRNSTYEARDNGKVIYKDFDQNFTDCPCQGQRVGKIVLEKGAQQITVNLPCKLRAMRVQPGKNVMLTLPRFGWDKKYFFVEKRTLVTEKGRNGVPVIGIDLVLRETAPEVFDWNSGEETIVDPASDSNLPTPFDVPKPGIPSITEELYRVPGGGLKTRITFESFVTEWPYPLFYEYSFSINGSALRTIPKNKNSKVTVSDVESGDVYVSVKTYNSLGAPSEESVFTGKVYGLTAPPQPLIEVNLQKIGGLAYITWKATNELDVVFGGRILVRHSPKPISEAVWENSVSIGEPVAGSAGSVALPLRAGTYLLKTEDSGGRKSTETTKVETDGAGLVAYSPLTYAQAHPTWSGDKDGTVLRGGSLRLSSQQLISEVDLISEIESFNTLGGIGENGTYRFASGIDLGTVKPVRLRVEVDVTGYDESDKISKRGLVSSWPSLMGGMTGDVECDLWTKTTIDDPNGGSPAWSDWQKEVGSEHSVRAFDFELRLRSGDENTNIAINECIIYADEVS